MKVIVIYTQITNNKHRCKRSIAVIYTTFKGEKLWQIGVK
jgi:hypothetical protein